MLGSLFLLYGAFSVGAANDDLVRALLWTDRSQNFSEIDPGRPLRAEFLLTNDGSQPVRFLDYKTSCGCISVAALPAMVAPGATGRVVCELNTTGLRGRVVQSVLLRMDHPVQKSVRLELRGVVRGLWIEPGRVDFGTVEAGKRPRREVVVVAAGFPQARLESVELGDHSPLKYEVRPGHVVEEQKHLGVTVLGRLALDWVGGDCPPGAYRTEVLVRTNLPAAGLLRLPVTANLAAVSSLSPPKLLFGKVSPHRPVTRVATASFDRGTDANAAEGLEFQSDHSFVHVRADPLDAATGRLRVFVTADWQGPAQDKSAPGLTQGHVSVRRGERLVFSIPYLMYLGPGQ